MGRWNGLKTVVLSIVSLLWLQGFAEPSQEEKVDVVILGGGSAGLTSGIYVGRAGLSNVIIEGKNPGGVITQSTQVYNWPGFNEISGLDLMDKIRKQAEECGAKFSEEEVIAVDFSHHPFRITVGDLYDSSKQRLISAGSCIISTGATPRLLDVPGEKNYWSKGVYSCAVCDGPLYKDKTVAVVGGGDSALLEAEYLSGIAKKVYVLNRNRAFKGVEKGRCKQLIEKNNVEILYEVQVQSIEGDGDKVESATVLGKTSPVQKLSVDAIFLAIGAKPNTKLFKGQIELDQNGYILLKKDSQTSLPGVFAAGDVSDPIYKQAIIASGEGARAAMQAGDYLSCLSKPEPSPSKIASAPSKSAILSPEAVEVVSISQLKDVVAKTDDLVVLDFYANWCGPCRYLGKFTDQWAKELQGKAVFCKVNVDRAKDLAIRYKVQSMPTVVVIDSEGHEVGRYIGVEEIVGYINKLKAKNSPN